MKNLIILSCLAVAILTVQGPAPPLWPETFSQDFVQGDFKQKIYESGRLWYDIKNNRQRTDFSGSVFEPVCLAFGQEPSAKCSLINVNSSLYVNLPQKSKCCKWCTAADGCTITPRDWLKDFQYSGEATLSGSTFYRWSLQGENYYATQDEARIPRRVDVNTFALDFIMNTYTTDKIDDSVFNVPNNCNSPCPRSAGSATSFEQKVEPKTLRGILFNKRIIKNLTE